MCLVFLPLDQCSRCRANIRILADVINNLGRLSSFLSGFCQAKSSYASLNGLERFERGHRDLGIGLVTEVNARFDLVRASTHFHRAHDERWLEQIDAFLLLRRPTLQQATARLANALACRVGDAERTLKTVRS